MSKPSTPKAYPQLRNGRLPSDLTEYAPQQVQTATIIRVVRQGQHLMAIVDCPLCGYVHKHGVGRVNAPELGERMAECGRGMYELVDERGRLRA